MDIISLKNICFEYDGKPVIENLSLEFNKNRFEAILGESGIGKTTLINIILGRIDIQRGEVLRNYNKAGVVLQYDSLIESLSVLKNLQYVCGTKDLALKALDLVGLPEIVKMKAKALSKGMKKRVEIARAISISPDLVVMDEPFGNLDYFTKLNLVASLKHFIKTIDASCIYITHDIDEAIMISDNITVFNKKPLGNNYLRIENIQTYSRKELKEEIIQFLSKRNLKIDK